MPEDEDKSKLNLKVFMLGMGWGWLGVQDPRLRKPHPVCDGLGPVFCELWALFLISRSHIRSQNMPDTHKMNFILHNDPVLLKQAFFFL